MLSATSKRRDDTPLDLLAGLSGSFARSPIFPPGLIEVGVVSDRWGSGFAASFRGFDGAARAGL